MSTLDHLTSGRIGWNIVTGYLEQRGARASAWPSREPRHALRDRRRLHAGGLQAMGGKLGGRRRAARPRCAASSPTPTRSIGSSMTGTYFRLDAIHLCEPSPQRTPVLYQAGASTRGRQFAAEHAECVFINGPSQAGDRADRRRPPPPRRRGRPRPGRAADLHHDDGDHRRPRLPAPATSWRTIGTMPAKRAGSS